MALPIYTQPGILSDPQAGGFEGLLGNPLFNMGLGILANNTGHYGRAGPAIGGGVLSGMQSMQQNNLMRQREAMQNLQMQQVKQEIDAKKRGEESMQRLLQGDGAYTSMKDMPVTTTQNVPVAPLPNAVAPNYGLQKQEVTTNQQQPFFDQKRYTQDLISAGFGDELIKQRFTPKEANFDIAPDGTMYDKKTGQVVEGQKFTKPESENMPSEVKEYQFAKSQGYQGTFRDFQVELKRAGASKTTVSVNQSQEKEEHKAVGKYFGEQYATIQKTGLGASGKISRVQRLDQLLDGVNTGKFAPLGVEVASAAQSLGFNIDPKLGNKQAAEAIANEMALEMRNPSGGAGMPGAMSDKDREFLKQTTPGIEKTPEGRKLIAESMVKLAKRDQEVARMARQYRSKHGTIDEGFYEQLQEYSDNNPLFTTPGNTGGKGGVKFLGFEE
jgi:hypothetical protein